MPKEEMEILEKFFKFRGEQWNKYIEMIDPIDIDGRKELDVKTSALVRSAFMDGIWCGVFEDSKEKE